MGFSLGNAIGGLMSDIGLGGIVNGPSNAQQDQTQAAYQSADLNQAAYKQSYANAAPYMAAGTQALGMMQQLLGMPSTGAGNPNGNGAGLLGPQITGLNGSGFGGLYGTAPGVSSTATSPVSSPANNAVYMQAAQMGATPGTSASSYGARAFGGPTYPGQSYIVGEHGPEVLHMPPGSKGYVEPNASTKAMMAQYPGRALGGPVGAVGTMVNNNINPSNSTPMTNGMTPDQIIQMDPSYQFQFNQGMVALNNSALASGGGLTGGAVKGALEFGQGLASQDYSNIYNRYAGMASLGSSAAQNTGELGMYAGMNIGNDFLYKGNAEANNAMAGYNTFMSAMGMGSQAAGAYFGSKP